MDDVIGFLLVLGALALVCWKVGARIERGTPDDDYSDPPRDDVADPGATTVRAKLPRLNARGGVA